MAPIQSGAMAATARADAGTTRRLVRSGLWLAGAIAAANILNAAFQVVLARALTPGEYSLAVTLFAAVMVLGVPALAVQTAVARDVAGRLAADDVAGAGVVLRESSRSLLYVVAALVPAALALGIPVAFALNVQHPLPLVATAAVVAFSLALSVVWGGLQGSERFIPFSLGQLLQVVLKFAFGLGLALAGAGVAGVMFGLAAGTGVTLVFSAVPLRQLWRTARPLPRSRRRLLTRFSVSAAVALGVFIALTTLDLLVARASFAPAVAGGYAAVSVAARAILLIPVVVTTVLFPHVVTLGERVRERRALLGALSTTAALGAVLTLFFAVDPKELLNLAFGSGYGLAAGWLAPLAAAMTIYSLAYVYLFHFLAVGRTRYWLVAAPVLVAQAVLYGFMHQRPAQLIAVQLVSATVLAVASEVYERRRPR
jgi:O-antigen/teichoic acid export membrane protein